MNTDTPSSHPSNEQWSAFLYGELPPNTQEALERHLAACADCRQQVGQWRETMATLDTWKLPAHRMTIPVAHPLLRWAAAAAVLLGAGLLAGRLTAPRVDTDQLRAELQQQFQTDLQAATVTIQADAERKLEDLAQAWAAARAQDQQTTLALYQRAEAQRKTDLAWLRRDVETMALNAEHRFDTTQRDLNQLAAVSQTLWERPDSTNPRP